MGKSLKEKQGQCQYCGMKQHNSKEFVCDMLTEYPLPFKISEIEIPFVTKNTEELKLTTIQNSIHEKIQKQII